MNGTPVSRAHVARIGALALSAVLVAALAATRISAQESAREGNPDERRRALISMWDARAGGVDALNGMMFSVWLAAQSGQRAALSVPVPTRGRWMSVGPVGFYGNNGLYGSLPQLDAGRIPTLAFHPTDRNTLYVGTAAGGVWKTTNEGATWVPLTDTQCSLVTGAVAVDPVNPQIVYVGTGEVYETTQGCGVLRSLDGGATWTTFGTATFSTSLASGIPFYALMVDRATAGSTASTVLVAVTNRGLFRSANSGQTWTLTTAALTFSDGAQHPTNANVFWAIRQGVTSSATPPGLWRSTDKGQTWTSVSNFVADSVGRMEIAVSPAQPNSVWIIGAKQDGTFAGLWRWDDSTATRTTLQANGVTTVPAVPSRLAFGDQGWYNLMLAIDPADANVIYLGGVRAYRSVNGGLTFTEFAPTVHVDWHTIEIDPNDPRRIFVGNDGGAFLSRDAGTSWLSLNRGLITTLHYPGLSLHPTDATGILTGMQDNGTILARNGMLQWSGVGGGDGAFTAINPDAPDTYYYSSQNGNMVRVSGLTARSITSGIDGSERRAFIAPFVLDPQRPTRLYFGATRLYRTLNEGTNWTAISPDLTRGGSATIVNIAVAPTDSNVVFVGANDGSVRYTRDYGATWLAPQSTLPTRPATDFAIDPADPLRVAATFGSSGGPHVFLTKDGGVTWTDITGSLPDVTTQAVAWGPGGRLFVGNMLGVYESTNEGQAWTRNDGLPFIRITDLVFNARTNRLVAATYGRGVWAYDFGTDVTVLRGDVNADGVVNAADALLIQQALTGAQLPPATQLFPAGDANCDGRLDILDALLVLRFAVGDVSAGACVGSRR